MGGNIPGGNFLDENFPGGKFSRKEFDGWKFSGWEFSGGNFPRTILKFYRAMYFFLDHSNKKWCLLGLVSWINVSMPFQESMKIFF